MTWGVGDVWLWLVLTTLAYTLVAAATLLTLVFQRRDLANLAGWLLYIERQITVAQNTIDQITAQLTKVLGEVVGTRDALLAEIKDLKDQIAAGTPGPELNLDGLTDIAQRLDDLTPDNPAAGGGPIDPDFGVDHPTDEPVDPDFGVDHPTD